MWLFISESGEHGFFSGEPSDQDVLLARDVDAEKVGGWLAYLDGDYHGRFTLKQMRVLRAGDWEAAVVAFGKVRLTRI